MASTHKPYHLTMTEAQTTLEVTKFLTAQKGDPLSALRALRTEYGIKFTVSSDGELVILNYPQIPLKGKKIKKDCPIYRECRQLVLSTKDFTVVARSFTRFFDHGENANDTKIFASSNEVSFPEKLDGSIIMIFHHKHWRLVSRASFGEMRDIKGDTDAEPEAEAEADAVETKGDTKGDTKEDTKTDAGVDTGVDTGVATGVVETKFSWTEYVERIIGTSLADLGTRLDPSRSYICEVCGDLNRVIRDYKSDPALHLLASRSVTDFSESLDTDLDTLVQTLHNPRIRRPRLLEAKGVDQIIQTLTRLALDDPTFEGVIGKVRHGSEYVRVKIKSESWEILHKSMRRSAITLTPERIIHFALRGNLANVLKAPGVVAPHADEIISRLDKLKASFLVAWDSVQSIGDQREFATVVKGHTGIPDSLRPMLFQAKKRSFDTVWASGAKAIIQAVQAVP